MEDKDKDSEKIIIIIEKDKLLLIVFASIFLIALLIMVYNEKIRNTNNTTIDQDIVLDDYYEPEKDDGYYSRESFQEEYEKTKHINTSSYIFKEGEKVYFDNYDLIVSVPRISRDNRIDYVVDVQSRNYGTCGVSYENVKKDYYSFIWDMCKIEIILLDDLSKLEIKITSFEELTKKYKDNVGIDLEMNEKYGINNNSMILLYNNRMLIGGIGEYHITGNYTDGTKEAVNFILRKDKGFEIIDDNLIILLEDDSDPLILKLRLYYNRNTD